MKLPALLLAAVLLAAAGAALAEEKAVPLKPGPGQDVVDANCGACHSLDYIRTNAPFMTAKVWDAEVTKMIKVFGAPIEPADAKTIIDYLSKTYGTPG
jgi:sulfite dehydrogenase (cytochrome) subunit B